MSEPGEQARPEKSTREQSPTDVERQTPRALFEPGDPLPNLEMWVLERRLGGGGFGEVWLARHERKGAAAVKFCTDPSARHKLVTHEKTVVARVMRHCGHHPNVVPLLECNLSGEIPWLMYEYVEGGTLAEALCQWRALSPPRRLGRTVQVLRAISGALGAFHKLDPPLIHRDLKPHNVLMAGRTPRITDFGIGGAALETIRSSLDGDPSSLAVPLPTILQTAGSSRYAPPEQFLGSPPNPRDDVFALGVIAYQMVVGDTHAVPETDAARELRKRRIPAELVALILKSVALDPERRPKDATEWEDQLAALVKKKTVPGAQPSTHTDDSSQNDPTEPVEALAESEIAAASVSQRLTLSGRGRWYARPAGQPQAEWVLVATAPAEVRVAPGEVYRFSVHSAATEREVNALGALSGLTSLRSLNLSYCAGVTDSALVHLKALPGLRHLLLRGCTNITDDGLLQLRALTGLSSLELIDCDQLSAAAIDALRAALPKCKVLR
jgi:serine/threonine protein kinase